MRFKLGCIYIGCCKDTRLGWLENSPSPGRLFRACPQNFAWHYCGRTHIRVFSASYSPRPKPSEWFVLLISNEHWLFPSALLVDYKQILVSPVKATLSRFRRLTTPEVNQGIERRSSVKGAMSDITIRSIPGLWAVLPMSSSLASQYSILTSRFFSFPTTAVI